MRAAQRDSLAQQMLRGDKIARGSFINEKHQSRGRGDLLKLMDGIRVRGDWSELAEN